MKSLKQFRMLFAILALTVLFTGAQTLSAQDNGIVTVQSKASFEKTVQSLRKMIGQNQMMVLSKIDQGKILSMTGLKLNNISLFVGNPTIGKKLFTANKGVGVAVPIRVNIFEGNDGKTYINYVKPSIQLASFNSKQIQMIAKKLDKKLEMLTSMLSR